MLTPPLSSLLMAVMNQEAGCGRKHLKLSMTTHIVERWQWGGPPLEMMSPADAIKINNPTVNGV